MRGNEQQGEGWTPTRQPMKLGFVQLPEGGWAFTERFDLGPSNTASQGDGQKGGCICFWFPTTQDASGNWSFGLGFPTTNVMILLVTTKIDRRSQAKASFPAGRSFASQRICFFVGGGVSWVVEKVATHINSFKPILVCNLHWLWGEFVFENYSRVFWFKMPFQGGWRGPSTSPKEVRPTKSFCTLFWTSPQGFAKHECPCNEGGSLVLHITNVRRKKNFGFQTRVIDRKTCCW